METLSQEEVDLRDRFLEMISNEERSDLPMRYFRLIFKPDQKAVSHLTFESKTELGAVVAYADWEIQTVELYKYEISRWKDYLGIYKKKQIDTPFEDFVNDLIRLFIIDSEDSGPYDEYLVEIEPIVLTPFAMTYVKPVRV